MRVLGIGQGVEKPTLDRIDPLHREMDIIPELQLAPKTLDERTKGTASCPALMSSDGGQSYWFVACYDKRPWSSAVLVLVGARVERRQHLRRAREDVLLRADERGSHA
jgi:hypothetical protein